MVRLLAVSLWTTILVASCTCGSSTKRGPTLSQAECDAQRPHIASLYRAALASAESGPDDSEAQARRDQQVGDDTDMILADCRVDPARFVPCIQTAQTAAALERDCVIPLDDRGEVEGRAFGGQ